MSAAVSFSGPRGQMIRNFISLTIMGSVEISDRRRSKGQRLGNHGEAGGKQQEPEPQQNADKDNSEQVAVSKRPPVEKQENVAAAPMVNCVQWSRLRRWIQATLLAAHPGETPAAPPTRRTGSGAVAASTRL